MLAGVIREHRKDEVLGNFCENRGRRNRRIERQGARDGAEVGGADADGYGPPRQGFGAEPRADPVGEVAQRRKRTAGYFRDSRAYLLEAPEGIGPTRSAASITASTTLGAHWPLVQFPLVAGELI